MAVIFALSADPDSGQKSAGVLNFLISLFHAHPDPGQLAYLHHLLRKGAHLTEYAVLALLWLWNLPPRGAWAWAWALSTFYAATDEFHQIFIPHRGPSVWDVALDSAGALCMLTLVRIFIILKRWVVPPTGSIAF